MKWQVDVVQSEPDSNSAGCMQGDNMIFSRYIFIVFIALFSFFIAPDLFATTFMGFELPLAAEARKEPAKTAQALEEEKENADRVKYEVMLASRQYDDLEAAARDMLTKYETGKLSADDLIRKFYVLVPRNSGKAHISDMIGWTEKHPDSYAAWYVLGRQYLNIARTARGNKWARETSEEQFRESDKYARLSRDALLESLKHYEKPMPSYRTLIQVHHHIKNRMPYDDYCFLKSAVKADPDSWLVYNLYFFFNTPRWGGNFQALDQIFHMAEESGMTKNNLAELAAYLHELKANYARDISVKPSIALQLYKEAFELSPTKENIERLYEAASQAKKATEIDEAISIYSKIIEISTEEYDAYFRRGTIYREEGGDIRLHFLDMIAAAKLGDRYAQNNIGYYYLTGDKGFPIDLFQARAWLQLSADQGYEHAKKKLLVVEDKIKQLKQ
jgi:TPR repeat protein